MAPQRQWPWRWVDCGVVMAEPRVVAGGAMVRGRYQNWVVFA